MLRASAVSGVGGRCEGGGGRGDGRGRGMGRLFTSPGPDGIREEWHGARFLDSAVHASRFWDTGASGTPGAQAHREVEAWKVRMLTSCLGEMTQKLCDKMGGNLLGAFQ